MKAKVDAVKQLEDLKNQAQRNPSNFMQKLPGLLKGRSEAAARMRSVYSKMAQAAGRAVKVGSFIMILLDYQDQVAEAGLFRATVRATPVLGDFIQIAEDYQTMHKALREEAAAYDLVAQVYGDMWEARHQVASRWTLSAFQAAAESIAIEHPPSIDHHAIGVALVTYHNGILAEMHLLNAGALGLQEFMRRRGQLNQQLLNDLATAANQGPQPIDLQ